MIRETAAFAMHPQRGAVLFVSTIILLVLSLLALVMAKGSILETRMAGAARSGELAQMAADTAMNEARAKISRIAAREGAKAVCSSLRCSVRDAGAPADPAAFMRTPAAKAAAIPFRIDLSKLGQADATAQLAAPPVYVVEDLGAEPPQEGASSPRRHLFRITAAGVGSSEDFTRTVEAVYSVAEETVPTG